ncbi:hypothetical protein ACFSQU_18190 [Massilia sp. GCM10020059]|uniref:Uncharacterized protein n=1 Tax=Massilia agrisoli TaxID=2892444 RepID=A0ABS8IUS4_9BURK|nr:hypothetical protein [Massilia agrisoli]MCC6071473.1 hypothetical protein [Massilia agrisoli]
MYSTVKRLRRRGERIGDREIGADSGIVGHLTIVLIENVPVMKLHGAGDDAVQKPLLPLMWRAKVVMIRGDKMLFQGFERVGNQDDPDSPVVKQEWAVQVMADQPAELARSSHRPPS